MEWRKDQKRNRRRTRKSVTAGLLVAGAFGAIIWFEKKRALRDRVEPTGERTVGNIAMTAANVAVDALLGRAVLERVLRHVEDRNVGLLQNMGLPKPVRILLGIVLLDWTLWYWHWLNHKVPALWRFHLVHHADLDMDASTALRFHFGEMSLSVFWRALQFRVIGPDREAASLWQNLLLVSILFHHSNIRLPRDLEAKLVHWIVTPRMHAIHHSDWRNETDSNWSSLLSIWDVVHGTFLYDVAQSDIRIGVPAWRDRGELTLERLITMPFGPQRDDWQVDGVRQLKRR